MAHPNVADPHERTTFVLGDASAFFKEKIITGPNIVLFSSATFVPSLAFSYLMHQNLY